MESLFLILLFLSIYSYFIYPLSLFILTKVFRNSWTKENIRPTISIIVSAYNEEAVIEEKIRNTLALKYPQELLEVIVSSDGSTDRTNEIVTGIKDSRIVLRAFERLGKTACLNRVVPEARGEIVLFTDANSMFPEDLLIKLVKNFAGPDIGMVTGWTKYTVPETGKDATGIYSKLEKWTKHWESLISSCVGADGAIFAVRKFLYQPLCEQDINDFVIPLHVIKQGKRVIMDTEVFCFEEPSKGAQKAYDRQVRITTRTLGAIRRNLVFLNTFMFGSFSFFLLSHKVIRMLMPFFFVGTLVTNFLILNISPLYIITLAGQIMFIALGISSLLGIVRGRIATICQYFLITFSAQFIGWIRMLSGVQDTIWTPQR